MTEQAVREHAETFCSALVAGDVERAIQEFSNELRRNVGEVLALLPMPAREATIESVEHSGSGHNVALRVVGDAEAAIIQTRWKDRDGQPTIVEASHQSRTALPATSGETEDERAGDGAG
jgi:hypothetical protein